jgi:hypothetical protein
MMTHRERLAAVWSFREPDRIPVELHVTDDVLKYRDGEKLKILADEVADNFKECWGFFEYGFFGVKTEYSEEEIEFVPGKFRRMRRTHKTPEGIFTAVTMHPESSPDFHWEKRFIATVEDMRLLADAPRYPLSWSQNKWDAHVKSCGESGYPLCALPHPLGMLARSSAMEEMFGWLIEDPELIHRFLEKTNNQLAQVIKMVAAEKRRMDFVTYALEMCIPPWMGHDLFDEFVTPYDKVVNTEIHAGGGKLRAHCHGNCGSFLETFADMGVDAVEPLEKKPAGDVDLALTKQRMGGRMLLSGNIASEHFNTMTSDDVRLDVREAIQIAGKGGGFTLSTSGASTVVNLVQSKEEGDRMISNYIAYLEAGIEFGGRES